LKNQNIIGEKFVELVEIMQKLRSEDGCPWDKEQTPESILPFFLEEAYEVIESVEEKDWKNLQEEIGDILLHTVFQAKMAEEKMRFTILDSLETINAKLIRRHPHVFGDVPADAAKSAKQNWEAEKHKEKGRESRLDGVPETLPSLIRAQRLQEKASYVGFEWDKIEQVWEKVHEEIGELKEVQSDGVIEHIEEEIGDVLFSIVNLSRFLKISSEDALRRTNKKFILRFKKIEEELKKRNRPIEDASLAEMDEIWEQVKKDD
jgi:tetrapyrrole methylase family protein / MazG family protein